jgi:hypothetical protein
MSTQQMIPSMKLTKDNYLKWSNEWKLLYPSYGICGQEILEQRNHWETELMPMRQTHVVENVRQMDGTVVQQQRPWTAQDSTALPARLAAYETKHEKYVMNRQKLMVNIISSIDSLLLNSIQNMHQYEGIINNGNHRQLVELIHYAMESTGVTQTELRRQFDNLTQGDEELTQHIIKFEELASKINAHNLTPRAKAVRLVESVNFSRYQTIIANWTLLGQLEPYPEYNLVKEKLMKYDDKLKSQESIISETSGKYAGLQATARSSTVTCYNCGEMGHIKSECRRAPVVCNICGQYHPTHLHDRLGKQKYGQSHIGDTYPYPYPQNYPSSYYQSEDGTRGRSKGNSGRMRGRGSMRGGTQQGRSSIGGRGINSNDSRVGNVTSSVTSMKGVVKKPTNIKASYLGTVNRDLVNRSDDARQDSGLQYHEAFSAWGDAYNGQDIANDEEISDVIQ